MDQSGSQATSSHNVRIAVSDLAKYYQFNCDKLLHQTANNRPAHEKKKKLSKVNLDTTLNDALRHRGMEFEEQIKNKLKNVKDCQNIEPSEAKRVLKKAAVGEVLYQLKFEIPEKFYEKMGIQNVRLRAIIPDFIEVKEENGEKVLMIIDAKASKAARVAHQFQVASYAYFIDYIISRMRNISISRTGGIYLPPFQLQTFRMDFLLPKIERFFSIELPRIMSATTVSWHYNNRCRNCEFVNTCRSDAKNTISTIPYLSVDKAIDLKSFVQDFANEEDESNKGNVNETIPSVYNEPQIEDLVKWFDDLNIKDKNDRDEDLMSRRVQDIIKYDKKSGRSPYMDALSSKKAQFIGTPTATFPQATDHNLVISISLDPFVSRPFGWAICLYKSDGSIEKRHKHAGSIKKEDETEETFVALMEKFVTVLDKAFEYLARVKSRTCVFVYSESEKNTIQDALLSIISMEESSVSPTTQHMASRCLFNLFEDTSLLMASNDADADVTELPDDWREFPRIVVLEQAIKTNIAMDVPGFYRLKDVWKRMVYPLMKDEALKNEINENLYMIDLDGLYELWVVENDINNTNDLHLLRNHFTNAVIHAYYDLLRGYTPDIAFILIASPPPFSFTQIKSFSNNYLGKLYFFKQFEAVTGCAKIRASRFNDLVQRGAVSAVVLEFEKFVTKVNEEWVARFILISGGKEFSILEPSHLKEYILVDDSDEGVLQAIRFPDMVWRTKFAGFPVSVVSLFEIDNRDSQRRAVCLKGKFIGNIGKGSKTYRLYKRYVDFNVEKVTSLMSEIDERPDNKSVFLDAIHDPNKWGLQKLHEQDYKELKATALKLRDSFKMSPSQKEISASLLDRRLQIVWGPPGSGKTHFLALFTTWYLTTVKPQPSRRSKNFVIGVTAFTRAAIDNLLLRILSIQKLHDKTGEFEIASMGKEANQESDIKEYVADSLAKKLKSGQLAPGGQAVVVGGTVWDWYKVRKELKKSSWDGIDMMIIDEGSQLLVSDASIVLECLNPKTGQLVVAGDHMQLGPIIQNTYPVFPEDHPLIFGSIQQCLMRREDGSVFNEDDFFLKKGQKHDFGPCTIQLRDNWRMNDELNSFFQKIYGDDYITTRPALQLNLDDTKLSTITTNDNVKRALTPTNAITLVKLSLDLPVSSHKSQSSLLPEQYLQAEADVVSEISKAYLESAHILDDRKPSLFIVTPHHRQRHAIQCRMSKYLNSSEYILQINTAEKMQGQECDMVIACFGFMDVYEIARESDFLFDRNRWNVAISRARCKVIVVTTDEMLYPKGMEVFANKKTSEGWVFLSMVDRWVKDRFENTKKRGRKSKNSSESTSVINWVVDGTQLSRVSQTLDMFLAMGGTRLSLGTPRRVSSASSSTYTRKTPTSPTGTRSPAKPRGEGRGRGRGRGRGKGRGKGGNGGSNGEEPGDDVTYTIREAFASQVASGSKSTSADDKESGDAEREGNSRSRSDSSNSSSSSGSNINNGDTINSVPVDVNSSNQTGDDGENIVVKPRTARRTSVGNSKPSRSKVILTTKKKTNVSRISMTGVGSESNPIKIEDENDDEDSFFEPLS